MEDRGETRKGLNVFVGFNSLHWTGCRIPNTLAVTLQQ